MFDSVLPYGKKYSRKGESESQEWFGMGRATVVNEVTREVLTEKMT